jgi:hypothetical protein
MIPEAAFVFSMAGLNASFAGLGGLFVGLRRGSELQPDEALRLRQVVEFAFANLLLAVSLQPCVAILGSDAGYRVSAVLTIVYIAASTAFLTRRVERAGISWGRWWAAAAITLTILGVALALATLIEPLPALYELLLVVMLARPMVVFVLVLGTIDADRPNVEATGNDGAAIDTRTQRNGAPGE